MIITCPSCATHHNHSDDDHANESLATDGSLVNCNVCGHSWLESRAMKTIDAVEVIDVEHQDVIVSPNKIASMANLPAVTDGPNAAHEADRIARAVKQGEQERRAAQTKRRAKIRGWLALAACICAPIGFAAAMPETVVKAVPGSILIYDKIGMNVNIHGLTFANVTHQYLLANNTRVLAIRGEIINVSGEEKTVPSLRFSLRSKAAKELYNWTLNNVARRPLRPGAATSFLTRVAQPPEQADDFQIRFALAGEIAKTASHESNSNKRPSN